jgi:hypothetical protein
MPARPILDLKTHDANGYYLGCRCQVCTRANSDRQADKRRRLPELRARQRAAAQAWLDRKSPEERRELRRRYRENAKRRARGES